MSAANDTSLVVTLTRAQLEELVESAVRRVLDARPAAAPADEWLDTDAAATLLGVHPRTVQKLVAREGLPAHRIGRLYRLRRTEVVEWLGKRPARARAVRRIA